MTASRGWLLIAGALTVSLRLGTAQVGAISGPANSALACTASVPSAAQLRSEGLTELLGDVVITCTGGSLATIVGAPIPTTDIVVYLKAPYLPVTSRLLASGASEAMLIIDEAGSSLTTGATGGYGPKAPQWLCTTAQQKNPGGSACAANVGMDASGRYQVAVQPGGSTPAQNVYQGAAADYGDNSVTFHNVPVLPPAYQGVSRTYRISNIRVPTFGLNNRDQVIVIPYASSPQTLPLAGSALVAGTVNGPMTASVNASPGNGQGAFSTCVAPAGATLAAKLNFVESFATMFKTRAVPLTNNSWASTVQNAGTTGQNIPGGTYGGFGSNSESGFILPSATGNVAGVLYVAGLADYGTRLKAVFTNIPAGITLYVSTSNAAGYLVPGGTSTSPYAVLVAAGQTTETVNDGSAVTPLIAGAVSGSDGLTAYPLTPDSNGAAAAIWEVVNANPSAVDTLSFSVYVAYSGTPQSTGQNGQAANNVSLSFAPEPGGGSFTPDSGITPLSSPLPRFNVVNVAQGSWLTINPCALTVNTATLPFTYTIGASAPSSSTLAVTTSPSNMKVTVSTTVSTPAGGNWLSASYNNGTLTVSVNPSGLPASSTPYSGTVLVAGNGSSSASVPVTLAVSSSPVTTCDISHDGSMNVSDVQLIINEALGVAPAVDDLNHDGSVDVRDVQKVINAVLGLGCSL